MNKQTFIASLLALASLTACQTQPAAEPTTDEILNAMLGVTV